MKKLLFLFDTDPYASVFDTVVAYDGGADRVTGYANVTPDNVGALVDGTIFTRGGKEKQNTAIFVGGGDMAKGEALLKAVKKKFFGPFRVSVMLDPNGSNTTAAAGVALLAKAKKLKGKKAVVLAGTGPVGMRAAAMLGAGRRRRHHHLALEGACREGGAGDRGALRGQGQASAGRRRGSARQGPSKARRSCSPPAPSASSCSRPRIGRTIRRSRRSPT